MIHQVLIENPGVPPPFDLEQEIPLHPGEIYEARVIRKIIERLYRLGHFTDIRVEVLPEGDRKVSLRWVLVTKKIIDSITFSGNHFVHQNDLVKAIHVKPGEEFTEARRESIVSDVTNAYQQRGYFLATVKDTPPPLKDRQKRALIFKIQEGARAKIGQVDFAGNPVFSPWRLGLTIRSQKREFYHAETLNQDIARLIRFYQKKGYLKAAVHPPEVAFLARTNEVRIVFPVEAALPYRFFFHSPGPFSDHTLSEQVLIQESHSDAPEVIEASVMKLIALYRQNGYPEARIHARRVATPRVIEVHFDIESGREAEIKTLQFTGNARFSSGNLSAQIPFKQSRLFFKTRYTQESLEEAVGALTAFYKKEGFLSVQISPKAEWDGAHAAMTILFEINEGPRTQIEKIQIDGEEALAEKDLVEALSLSPGMPYSEGLVKEGTRRLLAAYFKRGHVAARVHLLTEFNEAGTAAHMTYQITEGDPVYMGSLKIEGALHTKPRVILREMVLHEKDPYHPDDILKSQQGLYRTGLFSSVRFDPLASSPDPSRQDLLLTVVERPRIVMDFNFGYSDYERWRGLFELAHRNLWGTGRSASTRIEASRIEETYSLNYREPRFFFKNTEAQIDAAYSDKEALTFFSKTAKITAGMESRFSERLKGSLRYEYKRVDVIPTASTTLSPEDLGKIHLASVKSSLTRNTQNDLFNPTAGSIHEVEIQSASKALGSGVQLFKLVLQRRSYHALSPRWVIALSTRMGLADRFGETLLIPPTERFFAGGRGSVRGYQQDQLGISGKTLLGGKPTGGNALLVLNEELRVAIGKSFGVVLFFDHGNIWERHQDFAFSQVKSTTGIGLRYNTPVGPLGLDWGYKLNREAGEGASEFHYAFLQAF